MADRLSIRKTHKLFIGGRFPRGESGRYLTVMNPHNPGDSTLVCRASRKDLREAVSAARSGFRSWAATTPYLRGQILYRAAEMLESRAGSIATEALEAMGTTRDAALEEVASSVDRLAYHAGWTDKLSQVFGSVNPVGSPHFNFTQPEPVSVVTLFTPADPPLLACVDLIASILAGGNSCVVVIPAQRGLVAAPLGEVFATSDLPAGAVNLLTAEPAELASWAAGHMDINAIVDAAAEPGISATLDGGSAHNLKRIHRIRRQPGDWFADTCRNPSTILATLEAKTTWHPVGA